MGGLNPQIWQLVILYRYLRFSYQMYILQQVQPQQGAFVSINRKNGRKGGPRQSAIQMVLTAQIGTGIWVEVGYSGSPISQTQTDWIITSNQLKIEWTQVFDSQTASMQIPVLFVSAQVQLYSQEYMSGDPHISRFFSYLSIFTFFMQIQITAENQLVQFQGWEGVGQASYLQINFWYTRITANLAGQKAFILNRVGDWGLTLGIIFTICIIGDVSYTTLQSIGQYLNKNIIFILSVLFQIGAAAKSAQFSGLHSWQASAMEGPTPVSAQIHAATMVTAGVYLQIRLSPLLEWSSNSLLQITWVGGISALQGAACGLQENDIKKVIAFSTTSQQGYMVVACGQSQYNLGLFHLINHAFFKALLFLSAGAVIHAIADQQDMRKMGSQIMFIPFSYLGIFMGSISLMAFPFMTGFYSKDLILELIQIPYNYTKSIGYIFSIQAAYLSAIYSIRQIILTFISKPNFPFSLLFNKIIVDPSLFMLSPLFFQTLGSAFFGYLFHELFLSFGSNIYSNSIFIHPNNLYILDGSMISTISDFKFIKFIPLFTFFFFISLLPFNNNKKTEEATRGGVVSHPNRSIENYLKSSKDSKIFFNKILVYNLQTINNFNIYNVNIIYYTLKISNLILRYWDRGLIERVGPFGLTKLIHPIGGNIERILSGKLINYALLILSFINLFLFFSLFNSQVSINIQIFQIQAITVSSLEVSR